MSDRDELARVRDMLGSEQPSDEDWVARANEPLSGNATEALNRLEALVKETKEPAVRAEALAVLRRLLWHPVGGRRVTNIARPWLADPAPEVRKNAVLAFSLGGGDTSDVEALGRLLETDASADVRAYAAYAASTQITIDRVQSEARGRSPAVDEDLLRRMLDVVERVVSKHARESDAVRSATVHLAESILDEPLGSQGAPDEAEARMTRAIARWREAHPPFDPGLE